MRDLAAQRLIKIAGLLAVLAGLTRPASSHAASVTAYPRVPGDAANSDYVTVKVNGSAIDTVATTMNTGYVHFACDGPAHIEITAREPIRTFDLSPHRLGLTATVDGNTLSFDMPGPRKLHLRINGLQRFFIFADPPEILPPQPGQPGVESVSAFGVVSSPDQVQTGAMQKAIDEVASRKGTLYVPPGIYRAGRLDLRSNLSLYLAPGAIIKGTGNLADYRRGQGGVMQVQIENADNVRIFGRGVLDGFGQALRRSGNDATSHKAKLITTYRTHNLRIEDVLLREAGVWAVHMIDSSDIHIANVKLLSMTRADWMESTGPFVGGNADGFDPDNASRVIIENNFISCDDDAIAVKLTGGQRNDMTDIQFRNNVIWTMCSALKLGTEIRDKTLSNVVFENNDIVHADVGIAVWCWRGGTVDGARWVNNHFEGVGTVKNDSPHKKESNIRLTIRDVEAKGHVRNLLIKDNTFEQFAPNDSLIQGLDAEHIFDGIVLENLVVAGKKRTNPDDARLTVGRFAENVTFK